MLAPCWRCVGHWHREMLDGLVGLREASRTLLRHSENESEKRGARKRGQQHCQSNHKRVKVGQQNESHEKGLSNIASTTLPVNSLSRESHRNECHETGAQQHWGRPNLKPLLVMLRKKTPRTHNVELEITHEFDMKEIRGPLRFTYNCFAEAELPPEPKNG